MRISFIDSYTGSQLSTIITYLKIKAMGRGTERQREMPSSDLETAKNTSKYPTAKITRTSEITHTTNTNATHPWRTNEACKYMKSRFLQHLFVSFYELHNLSLLKYENHILSSPSKSLGNARLLTKRLLSYLQSLKRSLASLAV